MHAAVWARVSDEPADRPRVHIRDDHWRKMLEREVVLCRDLHVLLAPVQRRMQQELSVRACFRGLRRHGLPIATAAATPIAFTALATALATASEAAFAATPVAASLATIAAALATSSEAANALAATTAATAGTATATGEPVRAARDDGRKVLKFFYTERARILLQRIRYQAGRRDGSAFAQHCGL